jgi:hypothetical protein
MRSPRSLVVIVALAAGASLLAACGGDTNNVSTSPVTTTSSAAATTTTTTGPCTVPDVSTDSKTGTGPTDVALLTDVRSGSQPCADRVTFEFRDGAAPAYTVEYQPGPFSLGESGQSLTIDGTAFLVVTFPHAAGVDLTDPAAPSTYTGPESIHPTGLTHVREIRRLEDFEGVLKWVIGLDGTRPFTVATLDGPPRVYLDIR